MIRQKLDAMIRSKEIVWIILVLLLFFLLLYVVNHTQELVNSRDQEWMKYMADCKCQCNNLNFPGRTADAYGNFTLNLSTTT